jgi:hypothetical protein
MMEKKTPKINCVFLLEHSLPFLGMFFYLHHEAQGLLASHSIFELNIYCIESQP